MYSMENEGMQKLTADSLSIQPRLLSVKQFMIYSGMGRNRAVEYARQNGWIVQFGRRVFVDKVKFDKYIEQNICN